MKRYFELQSLALIVLCFILYVGLDDGTVRLYSLTFFGMATIGSCILWWLSVRLGPQQPRPRTTPSNAPKSPANAILVDGSNVMHWGGDPSVMVLTHVLNSLKKQGHVPIVYFDANYGYKLWGRPSSLPAISGAIGLPPNRVFIAPSRTTADALLLPHATRDKLKIVTNDRFLDWKEEFPILNQRDLLVKGDWKEGTVIWRAERRKKRKPHRPKRQRQN
ncbi:NYN domain-containing protein [Cochlodiniinecator piscidefendens]|uniref:NYN domain-containing protein n=1 Tax=Cochlodiniinecator piscidefendens TaxID=2715756 RepID=UPI00140DBE0B|nr:hypothetical protein [Cochlodiniinecator piscidefendens]